MVSEKDKGCESGAQKEFARMLEVHELRESLVLMLVVGKRVARLGNLEADGDWVFRGLDQVQLPPPASQVLPLQLPNSSTSSHIRTT
jgi:hypothetical protein